MTGIDFIYELFITEENIVLPEVVMEEFVSFVLKLIKEGSPQLLQIRPKLFLRSEFHSV